MLGGGVSHPSQLTTGLVIKSVTTSPTLAGERMLFILQVSILSEQTRTPITSFDTNDVSNDVILTNHTQHSMMTFLARRNIFCGQANPENGVLRKLKHIFPNTYQRIKSIHSPAKGGTGCYRFNYQPGS